MGGRMGPSISVRKDRELSVRIERDGGALLLRVSGAIELASAWMLEGELDRAFGGDASSIALDLGDVDFIDAAGLWVLVSGAKRFRDQGDRLFMSLGESGAVRQLVEFSGVEGELPLTG